MKDKLIAKMKATKQKQDGRKVTEFMATMAGDDAVVEGVISTWKITDTGKLSVDKEVSFNMPVTTEREVQLF